MGPGKLQKDHLMCHPEHPLQPNPNFNDQKSVGQLLATRSSSRYGNQLQLHLKQLIFHRFNPLLLVPSLVLSPLTADADVTGFPRTGEAFQQVFLALHALKTSGLSCRSFIATPQQAALHSKHYSHGVETGTNSKSFLA
jgi:hypothetical protein